MKSNASSWDCCVKRPARSVLPYLAHYNAERYHQGMNGKHLTGDAAAANDNNATGVVKVRSRSGRTLNFYHREAA